MRVTTEPQPICKVRIRAVAPLLLAALLHLPASARWDLTWSDEFSVDGLPDPANWGYEQGYVRNNEAQYYTASRLENARVEDGHLIVEGRRDNWQDHEYTSASIITRGKHEFLYGRFELRAKIDIQMGSWPAWWAVGVEGGWPAGGEIDMMEFYNGKILFNTYCGNDCGGGWDVVTVPVDAAWAAQFHVWEMIWDENFIKLHIDGELMNTTDLSRTFTGGQNPFRKPIYMFINQALGGNSGGSLAATQFPVRYEVDYVRVYEWNTDIPALNGAVIGAGDPYQGSSAVSYSRALDGDISTFSDCVGHDTLYVGYEFDSPKLISSVDYYPRNGYADRMEGQSFQVSLDAINWTTVHTIATTPVEGQWTTAQIAEPVGGSFARYVTGPAGHLNVAEIRFYGEDDTSQTVGLSLSEISPAGMQVTHRVLDRKIVVSVPRTGTMHTLLVTDPAGRLVHMARGTGAFRIEGLATGVYILKVISGRQAVSRRMSIFW